MSLKKYTTYAFLVLTLLFSFAFNANAQQEGQVLIEEPEVYVSNFSVSAESYNAGDVVSGSFILRNGRNKAVSDVYYELSAVNMYSENGLAEIIFDSKNEGPFFLRALEEQVVRFDYTLPVGFSGNDVGIQIRAVLGSGIPMGWDDAIFEVKQGLFQSLLVKDAFILVNTDKFSNAEGPSISKDQKVSAYVKFSNKENPNFEATPVVSVYERSVSGDAIDSFELGDVFVSGDGEGEVAFSLPSSYKSSVYVARLKLLNSDGLQVSSVVDFRYIISGDIAFIDWIEVDKFIFNKNESIVISLSVVGAPYNIQTGLVESSGDASLEIRALNENGKIIGEKKVSIDLHDDTQEEIILQSEVSAQAISIQAVVLKDGKVLAEKEVFFGDPLVKKDNRIMLLGIGLLFLLALLVLLFKKMIHKKTVPYIVFVLLLVAGIFSSTNVVSAWTTTDTRPLDGASTYGGNPSVSIINSPNGTYSPGQAFSVTGTIYARSCLNVPQEVKIFINGVFKGTLTKASTGNSSYTSNRFDFSFPGYAAATTPGTHYVYMRFENYRVEGTGTRTITGWTEGYQPYEVGGPPPTSAPTNLVASTGACGRNIDLSWDPVSEADSYNVYRGGTTLIASDLKGTFFTDSGLAPGTYTYVVKAVNSVGFESERSNAVSARASGTCPLEVPNLTATTSPTCGGKIKLDWIGISGANGYKIYRDGDYLLDLNGGTASAPITYTDSNLNPGQSYSYTIRSKSSTDASTHSSPAQATASISCTPVVPVATTLTANPGVCGGNVNLSWDAITGVTGYRVYRDNQLITELSATSFINSVTPNTSFTYHVTSFNVNGESLPSGSKSVTSSTACVIKPPPPTGSSVQVTQGACGGNINISWTSVSGATGYNVYRSATSGGTYIKRNSSPLTGTSYPDTGTSGTQYFYKITSLNSAGESNPSSPPGSGNASQSCVVPPTIPTNVQVTAGACGGNAVIAWNNVTGDTSYELYRDGDLISSNAVSPYADGGLTSGAQYSYKLKAVNSAGKSAFSNEVSGNASQSCVVTPSTPINVVAITGACGGNINVSWNAVSEAVSYRVYVDNSFKESVTTNLFTHSGLISGESHSYRIKAVNSSGTESVNASDPSNTSTSSGNCPGGPPTGDPITVTLTANGSPDLSIQDLNTSVPVTLTATITGTPSACVATMTGSNPSQGTWNGVKANVSFAEGLMLTNPGTYTFTLNCDGKSDSVPVTLTLVGTTTGTVNVICKAVDANGNPLSTVFVGDPITWQAEVQLVGNKPSPNYDFKWHGNGFSTVVTGSSPAPVIKIDRVYTTTGSKQVWIEITGTGAPNSIGSCEANPATVQVRAKPVFEPF